ncbi:MULTISPECIES: GntR family transcriptional regulator [Mycobacteriaceae]|uniref:GntR family transcriptional regulator n=2 Tax=Mycolicibacterium TaxID=1866885 RepID=A0AAD1MDH8_9MYCO|nr:GntR family transcriptional regulator [Mycolicibacterium aichiense]MCV7017026.1 GntR family transcriptional regulator [Mycolicibacterium aichiense]BBX10547.1 GntR family transcriptional regulator [Mycolicibacterium aichiense]STZ25795.1 GntR family transcriptional regulator [Mycolicibacterium aichiense]
MSGSERLGAVPSLSAQIRRKTYEHVYRALRHALITGQIPHGTHLVETELAAQLGVSRTPVRDALRRLESDGFAERGSGGGLWSRGIVAEEIEDLFLVRAELEKLAARLACERAKPEQWAEPRALLATMATVIDTHGVGSEEFAEVHLAFHSSIYRIAFGDRFAGLLDGYLLQCLDVAAELSYRDPGRTLPAVEQHEHLLNEVCSGHVDRAVAAAEAHVRRGADDAQRAHTDTALS